MHTLRRRCHGYFNEKIKVYLIYFEILKTSSSCISKSFPKLSKFVVCISTAILDCVIFLTRRQKFGVRNRCHSLVYYYYYFFLPIRLNLRDGHETI